MGMADVISGVAMGAALLSSLAEVPPVSIA